MEGGLVGAGHAHGKGFAAQFGAADAEHVRAFEIGFEDDAPGIEGEIAGRGEIVEAGVAVPGLGQFDLGAAQLLVLQLKFNLVDPQLVDKAGQVGVGKVLVLQGRGRRGAAFGLRRSSRRDRRRQGRS